MTYCMLVPALCLAALTACGGPSMRVLEYNGAATTDTEDDGFLGIDLGDVDADIQGCRVDFGENQIPDGVTINYRGELCDVSVAPGGVPATRLDPRSVE